MKSKGDFMEQLRAHLCPSGEERVGCITSPSSVRCVVECGPGLQPRKGDKIQIACSTGTHVMYAVKDVETLEASTMNTTKIALTLFPLMYYYENRK